MALYVPGPCTPVLNGSLIARLRGGGPDAPVCLWTGPARLRVRLSAYTSIRALDVISLRAGALHPLTMYGEPLASCLAADGLSKCASNFVHVAPPGSAPRPVASLAVDALASACNDLRLSAHRSSGGGVHALHHEWSVSLLTPAARGAADAIEALRAHAAAADPAGRALTLPFTLLQVYGMLEPAPHACMHMCIASRCPSGCSRASRPTGRSHLLCMLIS